MRNLLLPVIPTVLAIASPAGAETDVRINQATLEIESSDDDVDHDITVDETDANLIVHDRGSPLTAGRGCVKVRDYRDGAADVYVRCAKAGLGGIFVWLEHGTNRVAIRTTTAAYGAEVWGGVDDDTIIGGPGDDQLYGNLGDDDVDGRGGDDLVDGSGGNDVLRGGAGDDHVEDVSGWDELYGGTGDDQLAADDWPDGAFAADHLDGGAGHDLCHVDVFGPFELDAVTSCEGRY